MKRTLSALCAIIAALTIAVAQPTADYRVVPLPRHIVAADGQPFVLTADVPIVCADSLRREALFLSDYIRQTTGLQLAVVNRTKAKTAIRLVVDPTITNAEAYCLTVSRRRGVAISALTARGLFYGVQTLRKSLAHGATTLPPVTIADEPRFAYRGVHLDCSRHFFSVDFIKRYLDILALHNQNVFHWHLTDDQGWRLESKRYPLLTQVGSQRRQTVIGHNAPIMDHQPYGGYYTQEQVCEIVRYAQERHITVIPEIEMPGHTLALLAAYPELGCTGGPYEVEGHWGVFDDILCAGNDTAFRVVEDILDEVIQLFPSPYIHIGGDEAPKNRWQHCPKCQARIREQGIRGDTLLSAEARLQGYFTNRIEQFVASRGRRIIGWDEILEGHIQPSAVVMSWRGTQGGLAAAAAGHDVIMAPSDYCYFNFSQYGDDVWNKPFTFNALVTLVKAYAFEPAPATMGAAQRHVLGAQANLWTEYIAYDNLAEYQLLPRLAALSECQWMQPQAKSYDDFLRRLPLLEALYDQQGWAHAEP